ncbi:Neuroblastoma-amplified sequence, partial [Zootermopsis nevadensis]
VAKDANPQLRKLAWSPDCSMLAVAHSNGVVSFYDLLGSNIFTIYPPKFKEDSHPVDKMNALVFVSFLQSRRKSPKWAAEIILVDYQGNLYCYLVSPTDGYQQSHVFSFAQHYRQGVLSVSYHPSHNMLFVAGPTSVKNADSLKGHGSSFGLSSWRLLNDYPYYHLALSTDEEQAIWQAKQSWRNWVPLLTSNPEQNVVFKMQVSPAGRFLACLHSCGSISIWYLPAIRLYKYWTLLDQPGYNVQNPQHSKRSFSHDSDNSIFRPVDINWWTDQAVIIARYSGAISVCSVANLRNLLGESPEFLAGPPQVSSLCSDHGFLGLECEITFTSKKYPWDDNITQSEVESSDDNDDVEDNEDSSILNRSSAFIQSAVYMVTDMERFQPKRKRPKVCHRTYRLLGLKSTTPEELYARKIDNEEYGEALALAKAYNLDCDLVYQQQWRNNKVSIATIHDYLSKVTKRSWVLKECVERVPETFAAARGLLQFGLQGTDVETFISVAEDTDRRNFVQQFQDVVGNSDALSSDTEEETLQERNSFILSQVTTDKLTAEQQELLRCRQQLLKYSDRLYTYELIMGGSDMAEELYNYTFYDKFRTISVVTSAVKFAREGNWKGVEIMFTYHGDALLSHWLPVLSNFPETMNPYEYKSLLPECTANGNVFYWNQIQLREQDWCEGTNFQNEPDDCDASMIYEEDQDLKYFACSEKEITAEILTVWYITRVHQIESRSCIIDHALTLIKLARERHIMGLDHLYHELLTLDTLVYEVHLEDFRLSDLQKLSDLDTCKLLMSKTVETTFIDDLKHLLLPFLLRCEKEAAGSRRQLLLDYLIFLSSQDLSLPHKLFEHLHNEHSFSLVPSMEEKISLALHCLYAYPEADQLSKAFHILECVPERGFSLQNSTLAALHDKLDDLRCDLHVAEILHHNSISKPFPKLHSILLYVKIPTYGLIFNRIPPPTEMDWKKLLADMLDLQANCFTTVDIEVCFQIYIATLLASGSNKNIKGAGKFLQSHKTKWTDKNVSYQQSVQLVMQAALEYFDSSSGASDPALYLAETCLNLITDKNEEINEQLDLIAALQLLSDFEMNMLPLQVRLCTERLRLVQLCIDNEPTAYRKTQRLLQLAHDLRVCGNDKWQREGKVLVLIAEAALKVHDYQFCAEICQQLVSNSHIIGWQVAQELGQCQEFDNLQLRSDLLAFALLYCTVDVIEILVKTRSLLQAELLQGMIYNKMKHDPATAEEEEFSDALTSVSSDVIDREFPGPMRVVEDLTEITKKATYGLLKNIGNNNFWKTSFSWMQRNMSDVEITESNRLITSQGFPAFYSSLAPECHMSSFCTKYDRFSEPDVSNPIVQLGQALLRTILLQGTASEGTFSDCTKVLLQLSEQFLAEDSCLGLGHLFHLDDLTLSDSCFKNVPCTSIVLQLAMYYYAIQGYKQLQNLTAEDRNREEDVYLYAPNELVEHVAGLASKHEMLDVWAQLLVKYRSLLVDFQQGQQLQSLGCGVDLQRFTHDMPYQQDSIIGLAMTVDTEKFFFAVRLGSRHGVPLREIVARHLTSLLLNSDRIALSELTAHLANPQLKELLRTSPYFVCDRLVQYAYPSIEGTDHQMLLLYYTVLQSIAEDYTTYSLTPKEHMKLLRKVKAASSGK